MYTSLCNGGAEDMGVADMDVLTDEELMRDGGFSGGQLAVLCDVGTSLHLCNMYNNKYS